MRMFLPLLPLLALTACSRPSTQSSAPTASVPSSQTKSVPTFNADSAFSYVAAQMDFGPRVPGSESQRLTAHWLTAELRRHGAEVAVMQSEVKAYDGTRLPVFNIVGSFNPNATDRILLVSHWDCRHVADNDPDPSKRHLPVPSANDGASGVGVLLEIARQAGMKQPEIGIDIFLTDAEDYGAPDFWAGEHKDSYWALGTQEWCRHPHKPGYRATFGILLDMVGAGDATFYREYYSNHFAADIVDRIWGTAASLGYGSLFINQHGAGITDDHVFINRMTGIPTVDIIDTRMNGEGTFYPFWHTTDDTLDKISSETLRKVGDVLLHLIY